MIPPSLLEKTPELAANSTELEELLIFEQCFILSLVALMHSLNACPIICFASMVTCFITLIELLVTLILLLCLFICNITSKLSSETENTNRQGVWKDLGETLERVTSSESPEPRVRSCEPKQIFETGMLWLRQI